MILVGPTEALADLPTSEQRGAKHRLRSEEPAACSVRVNPRPHCGHGSQILAEALREAERELVAATTRTALQAAAKKLMRTKTELKRLQAESSA